MNAARRIARTIPLVALLATALVAAPARADVIMDWNAKADAIATEKQLTNAAQTRALAMMHTAMFDAVNAIERRYTPYKVTLEADRATSKEAAAASAAHGVLATLYPDQAKDLDTLLATSVSGVAEGDPKTKGVELGRKAAAGTVASRANDGSNATESYRPYAQPGVYVPTIVPIESTSGRITPFVMTSGSQFRPAPPPALTSETWTKDVNEIREMGGRASTKRSEEQTNIGRFWFFTGPRTFNPIVRQIVLQKEMDLVDCARLYALVSIASADAFIAVFDAKYAHNFWRPITAIRNADQTGNPATPREESWVPLGVTPMHPEYPCAHCIAASTVATVLQNVVGNEVREITITSPTAPGVTRKWTRLQDYADEVANARIWSGFHYRFSSEAGKDMGKKIGDLTVATQMRRSQASR
jgi:hypothetical protein